MINRTSTHIDANTSHEMKTRIQEKLIYNVREFINADFDEINQRMKELDREWSIERIIEIEAPVTIGFGAVLGLLYNKKWFMLSGIGAGIVLLHNIQGFHPLVALYQRLGFRSQRDIEDEYNALRVLRKDHEHVARH